MPRSSKSKFFVCASERSGSYKGKRFLGVNLLYKGSLEGLSLQELLDFLKKQRIDPANVSLPTSFQTYTK